jgi:phage shock protein A
MSLDSGEFNAVVAFIVVLLLSGNIWFVRRLVVKIDSLEKTVDQRLPVQQNEIKNISEKINKMEGFISHLSEKIEDFAKLRERIAILETVVRKPVKNAALKS